MLDYEEKMHRKNNRDTKAVCAFPSLSLESNRIMQKKVMNNEPETVRRSNSSLKKREEVVIADLILAITANQDRHEAEKPRNVRLAT